MSILKRIAERQKTRAQIAGKENIGASALWLISESLDDYIEHRIKADKTLEGIFKDIQGDIASMADMDRKLREELKTETED